MFVNTVNNHFTIILQSSITIKRCNNVWRPIVIVDKPADNIDVKSGNYVYHNSISGK